MSKVFFLTPGPSQLYFTAEQHLRNAMKESIPSISHRSKLFQSICQEAIEEVRLLLGVPEGFHIVFTNSATEIWERLLQNTVENHSHHFVNGSFSKRFKEFGDALQKNVSVTEVEFGQGFHADNLSVSEGAELIAVTQNETSAGVSFPLEHIATLRNNYPDALIAVDAVSSVPYPTFDFSQLDSVYFSVQKGMGLPAGLGVWIFNERIHEKAQKLSEKGLSLGTYHSIPSLLKNIEKYQTPATPNVLGIYLLAKVAKDMNEKGVEQIRTETNTKAASLYGFFDTHPMFSSFVKEKGHRSKTVIVAEVKSGDNQAVIDYLEKEKKVLIGKGYGNFKQSHIRIANFPVSSKEFIWQVVDALKEL